ncbi:hypothetical protein JI57_03740 [Psychromonas sp. PRT-SC03]|nr:hypothetical protein JI57_03740 [Psychromonas sp. PRT-SC03]
MFKKQTQLLSNLVSSNFQQKIRFASVGGLNTVVAYLAFMAFYEISARYLVSSVLSYFVGMMVSYTLNRTFVFKSSQKRGQLLPFCLVNLTSLGCSTATLFLLVHYVALHVYIGQALAVCVSMWINYLGYKAVFTKRISMYKYFKSLHDDNNNLDVILIMQWGVLLVFSMITLFNLHISMSSNIAHDALPYMDNYIGKFKSEGRWINFSLYYPLSVMPAVIAASLANLFMFIFAYKVAVGVKKEYWLAVIVAMLIINIPSFSMLLKWPMTIVPGCFMLALLACNKDKLNTSIFLLMAGVLLFATYPAFYFLMPLLFISRLRASSYIDILKFLCIWILGYVLGYAVANILVYLYTSIFTDHGTFIHFVSWRQETPSNSISALLANIISSANDFKRNVNYIGRLSLWFYAPIVLTTLWALFKHFKYTMIVLIVMVSLYASVIPLGITVPLRSGVTFPIGMAMLLLIIPNKYWRLLTFMTLMIPFAYQMHTYNSHYAYNRDVLAQILEKNDTQDLLKSPRLFNKLVVSVDAKKMSKYMWDKTGSKSFKRVLNLRDHYIKPYFNQYGWKNANIKVLDVSRSNIQGNVLIKKEGDILFVTMQ